MFASPRGRLLVLFGALCLLGGLLVYGGTLAPDPAAGAYPTPEEYVTDPEAYLGERVTAAGIVTDEDPPTVELRGGVDRYAEFELDGVAHSVERGEGIRVFGVLATERQIETIRSFQVPIRGLWYAYVVSFLAGLWALSLLVRTWRFDPDGIALVPREPPVALREVVLERIRNDADGRTGGRQDG